MDKGRVRQEIGRVALFSVSTFMIFSGPVFAQQQALPEYLDLNIWFKLALSALLAILIWIWNNTNADVKSHTKRLNRLDVDIAETNTGFEARIALAEKEIELLKHQTKTNETLIALEREQRLTKYHDKEETEQHRRHVENTLTNISTQIERMRDRMDALARPHHRFEDDIEHNRRSGDK